MRKELFIAGAIYFVTISTLLMAVYRFLENWHMSDFNFFTAGVLVILVSLGWGYILSEIIFAPKQQMEDTLTSLSKNIIHELNIPLATIKANTEMLRKNNLNPKDIKRLQRIDTASIRLQRLYNELVYTINKEIQPVEKERFDIATLLQERLEIFQEQQRNPLTLDTPSYEIFADKIGFAQSFDNIINNAMKYSPRTAPILISLQEHKLKIQDQGIGMSETELLRVHERYFQADQNKEGDGIGLALVKNYCDNENISIHINSQKHKGTCVSLGLEKVHT